MMVSGESWSDVDRALTKAAEQIARASNPEDFQAIGLFCREGLISLAQAVFDPAKHVTGDDVQPSPTDSKRMLDAFFFVGVERRGKRGGASSRESGRRPSRCARSQAYRDPSRRRAVH